jgi:hypothetical protein
MLKSLFYVFALSLVCPTAGWARIGVSPVQGDHIDADTPLNRALKTSSLTYEGTPFHAVMEIGTPGSAYSGKLEVWWAAPSKYRTVLTSSKFSQERIVSGSKVFERNDGNYYPRWLENFVLAVLNPAPMAENFHILGPQVNENCLKREERPGGITNDLTFAAICLTEDKERLDDVLSFNYFMEFKDVKAFKTKQVARTYETRALDFKPVVGRLTELEELKQADDAMFAVDAPTLPEQRISTEFVSTLKEESMVEKAPEIQWPSVREGKTEGYMIVYARTDRIGQVRETANTTPIIQDWKVLGWSRR